MGLLSILLTQNLLSIHICIFVDGLDEYEGDYENVVKTLQGLSDRRNVKICLSSRPLLDFERKFADLPSLKLQELTFDTIQKYAEEQLLGVIQEHFASQKVQQDSVVKLLGEIVSSADGVFLWAVFAVRTLRDGILDYANLDDLRLAIRDLPDKIEDLYLHILQRIKPAYRRGAIRFLQIMLYAPESRHTGLNICAWSFIDMERTPVDTPLIADVMDPNTVAERYARLRCS